MSRPALRASVRALVEFSVFQPDITPTSSLAMELGRQGHLARQGESKARAETLLTWKGECEGTEVTISGRMDLFDDSAQPPLIEEIKLSPHLPPKEPYPEHRLQAVCYGFMLCQREGYEEVEIKVSYVRPDGSLTAEFSQTLGASTLEAAFFELLVPYVHWQNKLHARLLARDESILNLPFPYPSYRPGQREMAEQAYTAIQRKKRLFAVMPTGTGKSAAVLYPAIKALAQGLTTKVFCLTARGTQRIAMQKEADRMMSQGLIAHVLTQNSKESLCLMEQMRCHPDTCERAKGHYVRQQAAVEEALSTQVWDGSLVSQLADRHLLCPFEFSLKLCEIADMVICDYNYALDPQVRLSRIFDHIRKVTLLVDESHNLPDRARDMLSGMMTARRLRDFRKEAGKIHGRSSLTYKACTAMIQLIEREGSAEDEEAVAETSSALLEALGKEYSPGVMHLVRDLVCLGAALHRKHEAPDDYAVYHRPDKNKGILSVLNLNPAPHLTEVTKRLSGVVYYSATLEPLSAMRSLLGGDLEDALLSLPSPFPQEHLLSLHLRLNTRFKARDASLRPATEAILALFHARPGKMIAYFPSFIYLKQVLDQVALMDPAVPLIVQQSGMDERQRLDFLNAFTQDEAPLLGFCVLGGVFSEGVDLPGKALTAAAIVGVGLPQVNEERDLFKARMEEVLGDGFAFAYRYPGMHKVLQAAGRLIRSENDRGVLLLMDDRYDWGDYQELLPPHLRLHRVHSMQDITDKTRAFWQENEEGVHFHG